MGVKISKPCSLIISTVPAGQHTQALPSARYCMTSHSNTLQGRHSVPEACNRLALRRNFSNRVFQQIGGIAKNGAFEIFQGMKTPCYKATYCTTLHSQVLAWPACVRLPRVMTYGSPHLLPYTRKGYEYDPPPPELCFPPFES